MADAIFLDPGELAILTGRKLKRLQVAQLRKMGIPFHINAAGRPIVCRSAVEGRSTVAAPPDTQDSWAPAILRRAA